TALHLMGLLSDGGVHSHYQHLIALVKLAKKHGLAEVYVYSFLDGRDVGPRTAVKYIEDAEEAFEVIGVGKFASITGRYYAMDRDNRVERVQLAYDAIVHGEGRTASSAKEGVERSYEEDIVDEFVVPFTIEDENNKPVGPVNYGDSIVFFNFRPDR